jgi:penicillin-binding protein 1B
VAGSGGGAGGRRPPRGGSGKPPPPRARRWPRVLLHCTLAFAAVAAIGLIYVDALIQREFSGKKWAVPAMVYGRPLELYAGAPIGPRTLTAELQALGYRRGSAALPRTGTWSEGEGWMRIGSRGFRFWDGAEPERVLAVRFAGQQIASVNGGDGQALAIARLDPVHIGGIYPAHNEDRILVRAREVPKLLVAALVAVEDKDFATHHGVSLRGIVRALVVNVSSGALEQGGSTLTQQLVKNFFLTSERTLSRKALELVMAVLLELHYDKEQILEAYLNEIYLGQDGHRAIHGFGLAGHYYFNRPLDELEPQQIALLVALVRGPSWYDPWRNPERALARRNLVLQHLVEEAVIGKEVAARLSALPLGVGDRTEARSRFYPAYLDLVRRQLRAAYSDTDLSSEGLRIFTGLDPLVQRAAERALEESIAEIERESAARKRPQNGLEGAVIVTRVDSGEVLALVGGRRARIAGFNRALDAVRPIGSLAKPAVYLSALESGRYTLLSPLDDSPLAFKGANGQIWSPKNYDRQSHGMVRLHRALAESYNQSTARLGIALGAERVVDTFHRLGIEREILAVPSVALGAVDLSPFEVAGMYQTLASGGFATRLGAIREVMDAAGKPLSRASVQVEQRIDARAVYLLEYALREVVREGTATAAYRRLPRDFAVAGKTGTTDDQRDSWFAGYSGDLLAVAWIGRDDNGVTSLTGATGALRVWSRLMAEASRQPLATRRPEGIEEIWVDDAGGGVSGEGCPGVRLMPFLPGTEPRYAASCTGSGGFRWPWESRPEPAGEPPPGVQPTPTPARPAPEPEKKPWWKRWLGNQ